MNAPPILKLLDSRCLHSAMLSGKASLFVTFKAKDPFMPTPQPTGVSKSRSKAWLHAGVAMLCVAAVAYGLLAESQEEQDIKKAAAELQEAISAEQAAASASTPLPPPVPGTISGSTETASFPVIMKAITNRMLAQRRDYEQELDSIGLPTILDWKRLQKDMTLSESRAILQGAKSAVAKYSSATSAIFAAARRDIDSSDLSFGKKRSLLAGFDEALANGTPQAMQMWSLEEQVLTEFGKIVDLLGSIRNNWTVEKDRLMFNRQEDLDLFNSYMANVQAIGAKQEKLHDISVQKAQEGLNRISR